VPFDGPAVIAGMIGAGLLWAALNNKPLLGTAQSVIKGENPGSTTTTTAATPGVTVVAPSAELPGGTVGAGGTGTPAANKALGGLMAAAYGWGPGSKNWPYLESGWEEESGWNQYAQNPASAAYGIPQANPGDKMASAGADWQTSPSTQIKWGLGYIKSTYGSPSQVPLWTPTGPAAGYVGY
jgi:hypothetical protein